MTIRVLAFARLREILDSPERTLELPDGASVDDAWASLQREHAALAGEVSSSRAAINGKLVSFAQPLCDGDELALLPPVSGG
ncbi:MAG: MoaD/ThiS family protein [Candidatus Eremiobacteraeota bacterium]|nr:MoaD/ThiS family protein [Candidatus Eremiobacteraeota bacterium]